MFSESIQRCEACVSNAFPLPHPLTAVTQLDNDFSCSGYELGSCASDLVWRKALREMDSNITTNYADDDDDDEPDEPAAKARRIQEKVKNVLKNWIFAMPNLDYTSRGYNVTPKLVKLVQILKACEPQGDLFRGIVFGNASTKSVHSRRLIIYHALCLVQRRVIAHAMLDILRVLGDYVDFLRPQVITGHGAFTDPHAQASPLLVTLYCLLMSWRV